MKNCLIIVTFFYSFLSEGQQSLNGTYITAKEQRGFETEIINFRTNGEFTYFLSACGQPNLGQGQYKIMNDSLILKFGENNYYDKNYFVKIQAVPKGLISIRIELNDGNDGSKLAGVNCFLKKGGIGTVTGVDGVGEIVSNEIIDRKDTLQISYIGYRTIQIPLLETGVQFDITANLDYKYYFYAGEVRSYKIVSLNKRLVLNRANKNNLYDKTSKATLDRIIKENY